MSWPPISPSTSKVRPQFPTYATASPSSHGSASGCRGRTPIPSAGCAPRSTSGAKILARRFGTLETLGKATRDELLELDEVGEALADAVLAFFAADRNREMLLRMREAGVDPQPLEGGTGGVGPGPAQCCVVMGARRRARVVFSR